MNSWMAVQFVKLHEDLLSLTSDNIFFIIFRALECHCRQIIKSETRVHVDAFPTILSMHDALNENTI